MIYTGQEISRRLKFVQLCGKFLRSFNISEKIHLSKIAESVIQQRDFTQVESETERQFHSNRGKMLIPLVKSTYHPQPQVLRYTINRPHPSLHCFIQRPNMIKSSGKEEPNLAIFAQLKLIAQKDKCFETFQSQSHLWGKEVLSFPWQQIAARYTRIRSSRQKLNISAFFSQPRGAEL